MKNNSSYNLINVYINSFSGLAANVLLLLLQQLCLALSVVAHRFTTRLCFSTFFLFMLSQGFLPNALGILSTAGGSVDPCACAFLPLPLL